MSGPALALALIGVLWSGVTFGGQSCCQCSLNEQDQIMCQCSQQMPQFCEFPVVQSDLDESQYGPLTDARLIEDNSIEYLVSKSALISKMYYGLIAKQQTSLKRLKLIYMDLLLDIDFKWNVLFDELTMLKELNFDSLALWRSERILFNGSDTFKANPNLISMTVRNCGITAIADNVITDWTHLRIISLAKNCIEELSRQWLPSTLDQLWSLDLSFNSIQSIPDNFFFNMPALRKLRLDSNRLRTLHYQWFGPIWERLHELWIDGNNIQCTPDLVWLLNVSHPVFFDQGSCISAKTKQLRFFYEIDPGDCDLDPDLECAQSTVGSWLQMGSDRR